MKEEKNNEEQVAAVSVSVSVKCNTGKCVDQIR